MNITNGSRINNRDTAAASNAASAADTSGPEVPIRKAPVTHSAMPMMLTFVTTSCRKTCARIADSTTLHAPRGATKDAGAKANAAKLPISPAAIRKVPIHQIGLRKNSKFVAFRVVVAVDEDAECNLEGVEVADDAEGLVPVGG